MKNLVSTTSLYALLIVGLLTQCSSSDPGGNAIIIMPKPIVVDDKNWLFEATPFWADEFSYTGLPATDKWDYDTGGHGWGNNEKQNYTTSISNGSVANGILTITARKESSGGVDYSSARLVTRNKLDVLYGRIEIRAKLPTGRGTWPAIWMLPTDRAYGDWPKSGEIDIMEHVGYDQNNVVITVHTEAYNHSINTQTSGIKKIETASTEFHNYRMDWTPYAIRGYIDDVKVYEFVNQGKTSKEWPFDKRFHLLLNVAVGGNWGGAQGIDETIFPKSMEIDHVRYYKMIEK